MTTISDSVYFDSLAMGVVSNREGPRWSSKQNYTKVAVVKYSSFLSGHLMQVHNLSHFSSDVTMDTVCHQ